MSSATAADTLVAMATASAMPFDPFTQTITMLTSAGDSVPLSLSDINEFNLYNLQLSILFAAQLGASGVLFSSLFFLTCPDRRMTLVFLLNIVSLFLNFLRCLLQCLYFVSPFNDLYAFFAVDYSQVPTSAYTNSVAAEVFAFLLTVSVLASLLFQVYIISKTFLPWIRLTILLVCLPLTLFACAARLYLCVLNAATIEHATYFLQSNAWITISSSATTSSICLSSCIFLSKLLLALRTRQQTLNISSRRLGNLQILAIGAAQCMILPAVFSILEMRLPFPGSSSLVLTFVTLSLPLTALWASTVTATGISTPAGSGASPRLGGTSTSWRSGQGRSSLMAKAKRLGRKEADELSQSRSNTSDASTTTEEKRKRSNGITVRHEVVQESRTGQVGWEAV